MNSSKSPVLVTSNHTILAVCVVEEDRCREITHCIGFMGHGREMKQMKNSFQEKKNFLLLMILNEVFGSIDGWMDGFSVSCTILFYFLESSRLEF